MRFEPIKKDHTAARRMRKYRARKLIRERARNDAQYRLLLQKFYVQRGLNPSVWIDSEEFRMDALEPLVSKTVFSAVLKRIPQIEIGQAMLNGNTVVLVRPKFFLEQVT